MKIVTISGANKDIGKSSLAAYIIGHCLVCAAAKFSLHAQAPEGPAILPEGPDGDPASDTARMYRAGARPVYWVRSTQESLSADITGALESMDSGVAVLEGNSILEHLEPDFAIFIMNPTFDDFKPSAWEALKRADVVLVNGDKAVSGEEALRLEHLCKVRNPRLKILFSADRGREAAWNIILSRIVGKLGGDYFLEETDARIAEELQKRAKDGRIACGVALKLAEELGVSTQKVGETANQLKLKIINCSLGCF